MVFTSAPGSTFTVMGLVPCFVIICKVVLKLVWPSGAVSVSNLPSTSLQCGDDKDMWLLLLLYWLHM